MKTNLNLNLKVFTKVGLKSESDIILEPKFDSISIVPKIGIIAKENGKVGFYDLDGNLKIPHMYKTLDVKSPEIIFAQKDDGKWGLMNAKNERLSQFKYDSKSLEKYTNLIKIKVRKDEKVLEGRLLLTGLELIKPNYLSIDINEKLAFVRDEKNNKGVISIENGAVVIQVKHMKCKLEKNKIIVKDETGVGVYNLFGKQLVECKYRKCIAFFNYIIAVKKDKRVIMFDNEGNLISNHQFDGIFYVESYSYAIIKMGSFLGAMWIPSGEIFIPCQYEMIKTSSNRKFLYLNAKNNNRGVVSVETGEMILQPIYQCIKRFGNLFVVKYDGKYGIVDIKGRTVLDFIYEEIRKLDEFLDSNYEMFKIFNLKKEDNECTDINQYNSLFIGKEKGADKRIYDIINKNGEVIKDNVDLNYNIKVM